jgi:ELWxxDGT repeat protein
MLFNAAAATGNAELYTSDGTLAGTQLVKEINAGNISSNPDVVNGIIINGKLLFPATSAETGRELYIRMVRRKVQYCFLISIPECYQVIRIFGSIGATV